MVIQKIRSVNGGLVISQANGKVKSVTPITISTVEYYDIEIEDDMPFVEGDLVRCQSAKNRINIKYYWVEVVDVIGNKIRCLKSSFAFWE